MEQAFRTIFDHPPADYFNFRLTGYYSGLQHEPDAYL
jgi:hypothetical protein